MREKARSNQFDANFRNLLAWPASLAPPSRPSGKFWSSGTWARFVELKSIHLKHRPTWLSTGPQWARASNSRISERSKLRGSQVIARSQAAIVAALLRALTSIPRSDSFRGIGHSDNMSRSPSANARLLVDTERPLDRVAEAIGPVVHRTPRGGRSRRLRLRSDSALTRTPP